MITQDNPVNACFQQHHCLTFIHLFIAIATLETLKTLCLLLLRTPSLAGSNNSCAETGIVALLFGVPQGSGSCHLEEEKSVSLLFKCSKVSHKDSEEKNYHDK